MNVPCDCCGQPSMNEGPLLVNGTAMLLCRECAKAAVDLLEEILAAMDPTIEGMQTVRIPACAPPASDGGAA